MCRAQLRWRSQVHVLQRSVRPVALRMKLVDCTSTSDEVEAACVVHRRWDDWRHEPTLAYLLFARRQPSNRVQRCTRSCCVRVRVGITCSIAQQSIICCLSSCKMHSCLNPRFSPWSLDRQIGLTVLRSTGIDSGRCDDCARLQQYTVGVEATLVDLVDVGAPGGLMY